MVGLIIGIVAVGLMIAVTVVFVIKGKECISKFNCKFEAIERKVTEFENKISYKVDRNDFNANKTNLYMLEQRFQKIENKIDSYDLKIKEFEKYNDISANTKAIESIQNELKSIKQDIDYNRKNIDDIDDFVAIRIDD